MNKFSIRRVSHEGFTLIEVLLVIGLLVLLAGVGVVAFGKIKQGADRDATLVKVKATLEAVNLFQSQMNRYPTKDKGLTELIQPPDDENEKTMWHGPYLQDGKIPLDPWGVELKYDLVDDTSSAGTANGGTPTQVPHVWSTGPSKTDGADDNIKSWTEDKK
jgi:general secretion pathway protein G